LKYAIAIALFALIGLGASAEQQNESVSNQSVSNQSVNVSEPTTEELAIRLLQFDYFGSPELIQAELLPGKLPEEMPVDLPIPNGTRIVGSEILEDIGIKLVMDVTMTPEEVLDFYRDVLVSQNWTETDITGMERGFIGGSVSTIFCKRARDPSVTVSAYPLENGTDLRLDIITDPSESPCSMADQFDWMEPMPKLAAPKDAVISNQNYMGGCGNQVAVSAEIKTKLNSSALAAHYADQLKAANWTAVSSDECGSASWSTWSFEDEDGISWDGFLIALDLAGSEDKRFVMMQTLMKES